MTTRPLAPPRYRGRFAPSPTGALHLGSLLAAVGSWLRARQQAGDWLVRIEDIDPPREVAGASSTILETLAAFGLVSDEPVWFQRDRSEAYDAALRTLTTTGSAFPCHCSRSDITESGGHHGRCQPGAPTQDAPAWRMLAPDRTIGFEDALQGRFQQNLLHDVGDFVLRRRDGLWAYQLAVVVDDAEQGITDVVRGADLLDSTPRQILLQQALGLPTPSYLHLPLLLDDSGGKLSKRLASLPIDPDDPLPALRKTLDLLAIPQAALDGCRNPEQLLDRAASLFAVERIARTPELRSATWNFSNCR